MCAYVDICLSLRSWVDVEPLQFEGPAPGVTEQQEDFEEGKYNMNTTYHFNSFAYAF